MNNIFALILFTICLMSCTKNQIVFVENKNIKQDTAFSIFLQKCPGLQTTCFLVNANESMKLEVKWEPTTNIFFTDTIKINKGNQLIYTKNIFCSVSI